MGPYLNSLLLLVLLLPTLEGAKFRGGKIETSSIKSDIPEPQFYKIDRIANELVAGKPPSSESDSNSEEVVALKRSNPRVSTSDVLNQAFQFVRFDSTLNLLINQLGRIEESHQILQNLTVQQETKIDQLVKQINFLAGSVNSEAARMNILEERIQSELNKMNEKLGDSVEHFIKSSTTSGILLELWKESLLQLDNLEGSTSEVSLHEEAKKVLKQVKEVKSELGDVGQASVQAIYKIQKSEESLVSVLERTANSTIYALRRAENSGRVEGRRRSTATTTTADAEERADSPFPTLNCPQILAHSGLPRDCSEVLLTEGGSESGIYKIYPFNRDEDRPIQVLCDQKSDGGGWTVFQRRDEALAQAGREDFYRNLADYTKGFGSPYSHLWLGLETIAELSKEGDQELQIDLMDWEGVTREANYRYFRVSNASDHFRLHLADYSGSAGDSLGYHNGMRFTTKDSDHDLESALNCAQKYKGGFWYKSCHQANLNGLYMTGGKTGSYALGVVWHSWKGYYYSLKRTQMKIRRRLPKPEINVQ